MPVTEATLRHIADLRAELDRLAADSTRNLTGVWMAGWDSVLPEFAAATRELARFRDDRWPTRAQIDRSWRTQRAMDAAARRLEQMVAQARQEAGRAATVAAAVTIAAQTPIIGSQLPPAEQSYYRAAPPAPREREHARERTSRNISGYMAPLVPAVIGLIRRVLGRGSPPAGRPEVAASHVTGQVERAFNGGLSRALVVAQTEMFDAARTAAMISQLANRDVLVGWRWLSRRDSRACPACWAQDGNLYPLDQAGPLDHQMGRCTRVPETRSWADLGFPGMQETVPAWEDAQAVFWRLTRAQQLDVMGPTRLRLLERGEVTWAGLSRLRQNPGWRPSHTVTPVRDLTPDA